MPTSYTALLGLALPVTGELQGTWGDTVNNQLTSLLDTAVAGTTTLNTDADVTLSTTTGAANQARQAIILWTANGSVTRNITAPAQSKTYVVINASAGTQSIVIRGVGPTTGVTVAKGEKVVVAWDGSDFVRVAAYGGTGEFTTVDTTNLEASNIKAKDGTASMTLADATGVASFSANPVLSGGTANGVLYLDGSKVATSGTALAFDGNRLTVSSATPSIRLDDTNTTGAFGIDWYFSGLALQRGNISLDGSTGEMQFQSGASGSAGYFQTFLLNGSEQMRLTSTGLGIGTSSPVRKLHASTASAAGVALFESTAGTISAIGLKNTGSSANYPQLLSVNDDMGFQTSGSERMRLDSSGNLGIGTSSPGAKVHAYDTSNSKVLSQTTTGYAQFQASSTSGDFHIAIDNSTGAGFGAGAYSRLLYSTGAYPMVFFTNATERLRIDSSGNLGLGVTPSAWGLLKGFDISSSGALFGYTAQAGISNNTYFDGSNWKYKNTAAAAFFRANAGAFEWFTAPSGTAGNAISFTQALILDANRNLLLNGTTAGASSVGTFTIFNGTAPTGSVTDGVILFAQDIASSSELRVRDEAGNVTTLSPHNFSLIPEGPSEEMAWAYYSEKGGKRINVDMLKLARMVEKLTGEKLVYES